MCDWTNFYVLREKLFMGFDNLDIFWQQKSAKILIGTKKLCSKPDNDFNNNNIVNLLRKPSSQYVFYNRVLLRIN